MPDSEKAVHCLGFDLFYVANENFGRMASDLRKFMETYPVKDGYVCHLSAWASFFEASKAEAISVYGTSVAENVWYKYDEEKDESIEVPLTNGREVYAFLNSLTK